MSAVRITFAEDSALAGYPTYRNGAPEVIWRSATSTVASFKRAVRKAKARGLRLLSFHFQGADFVADFGA